MPERKVQGEAPGEHSGPYLIRARDLRNALFHFRRGITLAEYDELVDIRKWLLRRSRILEGQEGAQQ